MTRQCGLAALLFGSIAGCDGDVTLYIGHEPESQRDGPTAPVRDDASGPSSGSARDSGADPSGCGHSAPFALETLHLESSGEARTAHVSLPADYDPQRRYPLVMVLHARNGTGLGARELLALEPLEPLEPGWAIFVYPDALVRTFAEDDLAAGWQNGPVPSSYEGTKDLQFVRDLVSEMQQRFCLEPEAMFVTGVGWGGDFSAVLGCFAGDVFRATAPVAANRPYFLPSDPGDPPCNGAVDAWVFHGKGDEYFPLQAGIDQLSFWLSANECGPGGAPLSVPNLGAEDECQEFDCPARITRSCWYGSEYGHDAPDAYYAAAVTEFFQSLL